MAKIYVIGGANIDIFANSINKIIAKDSNLAKINFAFGGVGRNIADDLQYLGEKLYFISAFSKDNYGKLLYEDCLKKFDLSYAKVVDDYPSSIYLAIMDNNHDLYVGCNDMRITKCVDYELIDKLTDVINDDDYLIIDTNFEKDLIEYAFSNLKGKKIMDAISVNKAYKLTGVLNRIGIVKLNFYEAQAINNAALDSEKKIVDFLIGLNNIGTKEAIITLKDGFYVGVENKVYHYSHDQVDKDVVNTTGAGDAFLAGYVYADKLGLTLDQKAAYGIASSLLAIKSANSVAGSSIDDLNQQINKTKIICQKC